MCKQFTLIHYHYFHQAINLSSWKCFDYWQNIIVIGPWDNVYRYRFPFTNRFIKLISKTCFYSCMYAFLTFVCLHQSISNYYCSYNFFRWFQILGSYFQYLKLNYILNFWNQCENLDSLSIDVFWFIRSG